RPPWRCTTVGTGSSLRCVTVIGRPRRASIVGPGKVPLYVHIGVLTPGRISRAASRWVISYRSTPPEVPTGLSTDGSGNGTLNAGGSGTALCNSAPVTDGRRDSAAAVDSP